MIARYAMSAALFLAIALAQGSFASSLPYPLSLMPLATVIGCYTFLRLDARDGLVWIVGYGLYLDLMGSGVVQFETLAYSGAALAAYHLSRGWLSNRSFYASVIGAAAAVLALRVLEALLLVPELVAGRVVSWESFATDSAWAIVWAALLSAILYLAARRALVAIGASFLLKKRTT
jgi:hypothetical protein